MLRNKSYNTIISILIACTIAQVGDAIEYVDLDSYKNGYCHEQASDGLLEYFQENWDSFKSSITETAITDNISSEIFWNTIRSSLEDGTFYNKVANFQTSDNLKGSDLFLRAAYLSILQVPVKYKSIAPNGDSIVLSGKIFLPRNRNAKNIIIANHYTICSNKEAPSEAYSIEGIFATKGYIVLMPDYIGYGISDSLTHPYLHLESTTISAVDLLKASIPYLNANCYHYYTSLILLGYSQGGAATLALQKNLEEKYADLFPILKVFAGAGPYDLSSTFDFYTDKNATDIPCSIPMLLLGMNYAYNLNLEYPDFFRPVLMEKYPLLIESKTKMMNEVNSELGNDLDSLIQPVIHNKDEYPTSVLYNAIKQNCITQWTPQSQLFLFHSTEDNMVPFFNSENIKYEFDGRKIENVNYDFAPYGNHMKAAVTFYEKIYRML